MPKISLIIPVYNEENYLKDCLNSVLNQTFQDYEVVCINDGSTDGSLGILKDYAREDTRFQIISQENKGQSAARNQGLKKATGDYVFFLDSDDILPPYALKFMHETALTTQAPVIVSNSMTNQISKEYVKNYTLQAPALKKLVQNRHIFSTPCNKLYKRSILKNHFFIEGIYFEDWPFITTLFEKIDFFTLVQAPCYFYRESNESTTRSPFNRKKADSYLTGISKVYDFFKNKDTLPLAQERLAVAVKMMVNKTYHTSDKELRKYVHQAVKKLMKENVVPFQKLTLKTIFRWLLLAK